MRAFQPDTFFLLSVFLAQYGVYEKPFIILMEASFVDGDFVRLCANSAPQIFS
jgi:hypothetical protein